MTAVPGPRGDHVVTVHGTVELDLSATMRPLADGASDPTWRFEAGRVVRAMTSPVGPVTVELRPGDDGVEARMWGEGSSWLGPRIAEMLGSPTPPWFPGDLHPLVTELHHRHRGLRMGAGLRLRDVLVPTILGQRVTSREARRTWWRLVERHGASAPGPWALRLPPEPAVVARLSDAQWHRLGVERQRADAIRRVHAVLGGLESAADAGSVALQQRLLTVPGVGPWTATALAANVLGDPDAVLLGDLHVPNDVCWALAGEPRGSDSRMLELLAPWQGQRARVVRLLGRAGLRAPRRGPRYSPLPIASW